MAGDEQQLEDVAEGTAIAAVEKKTPKDHASAILREFGHAETKLVGKAVVLADGKAGTVDELFLDEQHGLRVSIAGHTGKWPISTIKHLEE